MTAAVVIDLIILILMLIFIIRGAWNGFVMSLCSLLAVVIAFVGAGFAARSLSPVVADFLEPRFSAAIEQRLNESMENQAEESERSEADDTDTDALHKVTEVLRDMGLYDSLVSNINEAVRKGTTEAAAGAAAQAAAAVAHSVAYLAVFLLAFFLILLAWKIISHALDLLARLPGLHFLNKTLGGLFGLLQCSIILFVAAWFIQYFGHLIPEETVAETHLLKFFMTTSPLSLLQRLG